MPHQDYNPVDPNQNPLGLLLNSLLPWNHLPVQQPPQGGQGEEEGEEWEDEAGFFQ